MKWSDVESDGIEYSLSHLQPFSMEVAVGSRVIEVRVTFGLHVFTDEKGNGCPIVVGDERRYFCKRRYMDSLQAVAFMKAGFADCYTRPYFSKRQKQQFFIWERDDYAIFLAIQKPAGTVNRLKCHVVSAYTVDSWGKAGLPTRGTARRMGYVLDKRERGESIPP